MKAAPLEHDSLYIPALPRAGRFGECHLKDFTVIRQIGAGNAGTVSLAVHKQTNTKVAIKAIYGGNPAKFKKFRSEECTQHALNGGPYVAEHYCTIVDREYVYFVLEYVEGKELRPLLRDKDRTSLSSGQLKHIALQLIDATAYIQEHEVIHGDLKSANVLLSADGRIKLIDFGLARFMDDPGRKFRQKADIDWFLLGVHIYELLTRGKVFREFYPKGHGEEWKSLRKRIKCPSEVSASGCELIKILVLQKSPLWRLATATERLHYLRDHEYFR